MSFRVSFPRHNLEMSSLFVCWHAVTLVSLGVFISLSICILICLLLLIILALETSLSFTPARETELIGSKDHSNLVKPALLTLSASLFLISFSLFFFFFCFFFVPLFA